MKKTIITTLALTPLFVLSSSFVSCQKVYEEGQVVPKTISRIVSVSTECADIPEVKSLYEGGVGVHLTNKEYMSVYYAANDGDRTLSGLSTQILGTPDGNGNWTFSHSAISGAESYDYAFVLPYTSKNELPGNKKQVKLRLYCVQYPSATSFDPNMDFLIGKARFGESQASAVEAVSFKRLFAPVKLELSDEANVLGTEKIHAVSFALDKTATKNDALVGMAYVDLGEDYDAAKIGQFATDKNNSVSSENFGNSVTALNAAGIEKTGGVYNVWYIMNPSEIPAGTSLTVTVTSDTKTITRTVTLPSVAVVKDKINVIPFNISGSGCVVETSAYCDFSVASAVSNDDPTASLSDLTASDGTTPLSAVGCTVWKDNGKSQYPQALRVAYDNGTKGVITINPASGKTVSRVRVYTHPVIGFNSSKLELNADGAALATEDVVYAGVSANAGFIDFVVPEEKSGSSLTVSRKDANSWISGMTVFYK